MTKSHRKPAAYFAFLLLILPIGNTVWGQATTYSPYSSFGLGDRVSPALSRASAMGSTGIAVTDKFNINPLNPASYSELVEVGFEFAGFYSQTNLRDSDQRNRLNSGGLQGLSMVFPTNRGLAFAAGVTPFSAIGYDIVRQDQIVTDTVTRTVTNQRSGTGGVNEFYIGASARFFRRLNVGVNGSYVFGKLQESYLISGADFATIRYRNNTYVRSFGVRVGAMFGDTLSKRPPRMPDTTGLDSAAAAALLVPFNQAVDRWNARNKKLDQMIWRVGAISNLYLNSTYDYLNTVTWAIGETGTAGNDTLRNQTRAAFTIPPEFGLGFSFEQVHKLFVTAEATYQDWSKLNLPGRASQGLQAVTRAAVGIEYIPDFGAARKFWSRVAIRAGASYSTGFLSVRGQTINATTASFGLGIPVIQVRNRADLFSRVNIGVEYCRRGTLENNLVREDNLRVVFGVVILQPWFRQWRFD
jgi:hypothetical protein